MNRLIQSTRRLFRFNGYSLKVYLKYGLLIIIIYNLNIYFGMKSNIWFERSFEKEYQLNMLSIDVIKMEEDPLSLLGPPTNILSNRFVIENEYLCGRSHDPDTRLFPQLLIFVKSTPENVQERQAIRQTWGQKSILLKKQIRLAFVLGLSANEIDVQEESREYGDIIQIDQIDYYYYSSYKMIMMLRWISERCSVKSSRSSHIDLRNYVLFLNDNSYIHLDLLLLYIKSVDEDEEMTTYERRTFLTGEYYQNIRPERFVNSRWYVSMIDYPYDKYPPYLSSECFLMTRYNARLIYIASNYIPLFHFDYIYIGMLAYSMSTKLIPNNELFSRIDSSSIFPLSNNQTGIFSQWNEILSKRISFNIPRKSISIRTHRPGQLIQLWNHIHQTNIQLHSN